jgi:uncharacterized lipoprotein YbaY
MKKIFVSLICAVLLSSCSMTMEQFFGITPTSTIAPTFTITNTPTEKPTVTPTVPTPTFTLTPTLVGLKTKTSTPEFTPIQLDILLSPSVTPPVLIIQAPMKGFVKVTVSDEVFYKGRVCLPTSVKFTVQVADPSAVAFVVLFVRFKSKLSGAISAWTSIAMDNTSTGMFEHDLIPSEMKAVDSFENAWVQYQIVSTDGNSNQVGRTDIFSERLALLNCVPSPTPEVSMTPTLLAPK